MSRNPLLDRAAELHSRKMAAAATLSHTFAGYPLLAERVAGCGLYFLSCGENIAYSQVPAASFIHDGFMRSPGHRRTILTADYTHCGIRMLAVADGFYVTEEFGALITPRPAAVVEREINETIEAAFARQRHRQPVFYFRTAADFAQRCAEAYLKGREPPAYAEQWGSYTSFFLLGADLEKLKKDIMARLREEELAGYALGIAFGRTRQFPGGAYSLTLLLFPKNPLAAAWGLLRETAWAENERIFALLSAFAE